MFSIITPAFLGSIFILFVPVEIGMNTLQFTYLQSWLCHNSVLLRVTKVYFIELLLNTNAEFWIEFEDKILIKKPVKMWKIFFCQKTDKKFCTKIIKKNIRRLSAKVANNRFDRTHSRERSTTVVSKCDVFTLGSVETQLGWFVNFAECFVKYSLLFPLVQKV